VPWAPSLPVLSGLLGLELHVLGVVPWAGGEAYRFFRRGALGAQVPWAPSCSPCRISLASDAQHFHGISHTCLGVGCLTFPVLHRSVVEVHGEKYQQESSHQCLGKPGPSVEGCDCIGQAKEKSVVTLEHRCAPFWMPPHYCTRPGFLRAHRCVLICIWPIFSIRAHSLVPWPRHVSGCQLSHQGGKVVSRLGGIVKSPAAASSMILCLPVDWVMMNLLIRRSALPSS